MPILRGNRVSLTRNPLAWTAGSLLGPKQAMNSVCSSGHARLQGSHPDSPVLLQGEGRQHGQLLAGRPFALGQVALRLSPGCLRSHQGRSEGVSAGLSRLQLILQLPSVLRLSASTQRCSGNDVLHLPYTHLASIMLQRF